MAQVLILTNSTDDPVLPALALMNHNVRYLPAEPAALVSAPNVDITFLDSRRDLHGAKALSRLLETTGRTSPLILVASDGVLPALSADWNSDDFVLADAGPAELDARIRLAIEKQVKLKPESHSGVSIDEETYTARANGRRLDLTFKEFELLRYLAQHPGRVFSREQLLSEVWGYDYFGGTRTVDVHIRRLRAKLGELEGLIGTVRNVGYCLNRETHAESEALPN